MRFDAIDDPQPPPGLRGLAYEELSRVDLWMQVYALPRVLQATVRDEGSEAIGAFRAYSADLLGHIDDAFAEPIEAALHAVATTPDVRFPERLDALAEALARRARPATSAEPYVDAIEFVPEVALLATALAYAVRGQMEAARLKELLGRDGSLALVGLMEAARAHQFGRLAFRVAYELSAVLSGGKVEERVIGRLRRLHDACAALEPDLLDVLVAVSFPPRADGDPEVRAEAMFDEMLGLGILRRLEQDGRPEVEPLSKRGAAAVARLECGADEVVQATLSTVFWQATVWLRAARIAPSRALRRAAEWWTLPGQAPVRNLRIDGPVPREDLQAWAEQLADLAALRSISSPTVTTHSARQSRASRRDAAFLMSPWVHLADRENVGSVRLHARRHV